MRTHLHKITHTRTHIHAQPWGKLWLSRRRDMGGSRYPVVVIVPPSYCHPLHTLACTAPPPLVLFPSFSPCQLCEFVLSAASRPSLLAVTLETLANFVTWIPAKFIFETQLLEILCIRFLPQPAFRVQTMEVCVLCVYVLCVCGTRFVAWECSVSLMSASSCARVFFPPPPPCGFWGPGLWEVAALVDT